MKSPKDNSKMVPWLVVIVFSLLAIVLMTNTAEPSEWDGETMYMAAPGLEEYINDGPFSVKSNWITDNNGVPMRRRYIPVFDAGSDSYYPYLLESWIRQDLEIMKVYFSK